MGGTDVRIAVCEPVFCMLLAYSCLINPEDEGCVFLQNVHELPDYTASHPST
jgi:hypothetical protein